MNTFHGLALTLVALVQTPPARTVAATSARFEPRVLGLEIDVPDVDAARRFYAEGLGFAEDPLLSCSKERVLALGTLRLALRESSSAVAGEGSAGWNLNLRVKDLKTALGRVARAGGRVDDPVPHPFALGHAVRVRDPAGHAIDLLDIADPALEPTALDITAFNIGASLVEWSSAEKSFTDLGFKPFSREYLPDALPLERAGDVAVVLHANARAPVDARARTERLLLAVEDLDSALEALTKTGFFSGKPPFSCGPLGRSAVVRAASDVSFRILERSPARQTFERLRSLCGAWEGHSTKGWAETTKLETIAGGSAVLETSLDAHPGEAMATVFTMDGPQLVLTHICIAGNVPRLVAQRFEDEGRTVTFEFKDAANLSSRDQGHMDSVVYRFSGEDEFTSVWSWYQDGKTSWMEEIRYRRSSVPRTEER